MSSNTDPNYKIKSLPQDYRPFLCPEHGTEMNRTGSKTWYCKDCHRLFVIRVLEEKPFGGQLMWDGPLINAPWRHGIKSKKMLK